MNFDKECFFGGGGGQGGSEEGGGWGFQYIFAYFVLMLCIKFQVPSSSGSLDLTETKGIMHR